MPEKPQILFVLGGPGSGKGTQCDIMKAEYGFKHFSVGQLIRQIIQSGSKDAKVLQQKIKRGQMVESRPVVELLKKKVLDLHKQNKNNIYMIDGNFSFKEGFPRNFQNQQVWESVIGSDFEVKCLLFIECDNKVLVDRLIERGKTSGRADDNPETIKLRMRTFEEETQPVVKLYKQLYLEGKTKVISINGMFPIETVAKDIKQKLAFHGLVK